MTELYNLAKMTTLTTGTGTLTLADAVNGALTFALAGVQNGDSVSYTIRNGANSEVGRGTYTAAGTLLSRDTVLASTNSGAKVDLTGVSEVAVCMLVEDLTELFTLPCADVVVNENGGDYNFRVEGDNEENLLFLDAGNDRVGIGTGTPTTRLHVYSPNATAALTVESYTDQAQLVLSSNKDNLGATYSILWFNDAGAGKWYMAKDAGNDFVFRDQTNSVNIFKATAGGSLEFNQTGSDMDIIFQGDTDAYLLFLDAGNDRVGIGTNVPGYKLQVSDTVEAVLAIHRDTNTVYDDINFLFQADDSDGNLENYVILETEIVNNTAGAVRGRFKVINNWAGNEYTTLIVEGSGVTINEAGVIVNTRIESNNDDYVFFVSGANDAITIGSSNELGKLGIDGNADEIQLVVQGHSTQTSNLQVWENSGGTDLAAISGLGHLGIGVAPSANTKIYAYNLFTDAAATKSASKSLVFNILTDNNTYQARASENYIYLRVANTKSATGIQAVLQNAAVVDDQNAGTITTLIGNYSYLSLEAGAAGTVTYGKMFDSSLYAAGANTVALTNIMGVNIQPITAAVSNGGTATNAYGVYVDDVSLGATLNYSIFTKAGDVVFNSGNGQCDFILKGANYNLIETDSSDDEIWIGNNAAAKIGFFGATPVVQAAKASYNNWAAFSDVVNALVALGLFDAA